MFFKKGFTLIELLIVVAIIAILAAIAVPNFLEAQTRSKVSHQVANMRSATTALEAYATDWNDYPLTTINPPCGETFASEEMWKIYPGSLTTPCAYLTSEAALIDIFRKAHNFPSQLANEIMYLPSAYYKPPYPGPITSYTPQMNRYGLWVIRSAGPDTYYQNESGVHGDYGFGGTDWNRASYDPTNGTMSAGDIYRSQKRPDEDHT